MSNKDYVQPPKGSNLKKVFAAIKNAYSYLHPDYWKRKLVHLIVVVPMVFVIYGILFGLLLPESLTLSYSYQAKGLAYWFVGIIGLIVIPGLTILSAFFYPFSLWWYKQSLIGTMLNNIYHIGTFWVVILKVIGTLIGGILIAGTLAPVMGPLTLRKCKKKNIIIGDATDF